MEAEWPMWRLWLQKGISLDEIYNKYSYIDVMKANALLDMQEAIEAAHYYFDSQEINGAGG